MTDHELEENLHALAKTNRQLVLAQRPWLSFWRGVLSGVGATVGAAIVIAILSWLLSLLSGIDLFEPVVKRILPFVNIQNTTAPANILPVPSYRSADQTGLDQLTASPQATLTPAGAVSPTPLSVIKIVPTPSPTPSPSSTPI